ncbi:conjugal transfer protein TraB [Salmonella enterica]|nr:conjugal transfer protein TraB [Salmonella enterica]EJB9657955.1 conjugal transfer protein TraB [Salmonella enterica]EKI6155012.1 conjugal transfer protein TraB [Salmonella enterica]EMB7541239.1 conjugal transfer protein TraB [Salmonella enterica]
MQKRSYTQDAAMSAGRSNKDIGVIMKPEGSVKICVLNNSRQVDKVIDGEWTTLKVTPKGDLPNGIYQLSDALQASKNVYPHSHVGQVVHADERHVYQLAEKGVVQHNRNAWEKEPVIGKNYEVAYSRGVGKVKAELTQDEAQKLKNSQSKSRSL